MPELMTFVASCRATGMTVDDARAVHGALVATCARMTAGGEEIQYLRSSYLPVRQRWFGVFAAETTHAVRRITRIAQLPTVEVHRAVEFCAPTADGERTAVTERSGS